MTKMVHTTRSQKRDRHIVAVRPAVLHEQLEHTRELLLDKLKATTPSPNSDPESIC